MINHSELIVLIVFVFFLAVCINNIFFGEFHAERFCGGEVSWANPSWFSCGSKIDYDNGMLNYYEVGFIPPFTIQSYNQKYQNRLPLSKRWGS